MEVSRRSLRTLVQALLTGDMILGCGTAIFDDFGSYMASLNRVLEMSRSGEAFTRWVSLVQVSGRCSFVALSHEIFVGPDQWMSERFGQHPPSSTPSHVRPLAEREPSEYVAEPPFDDDPWSTIPNEFFGLHP